MAVTMCACSKCGWRSNVRSLAPRTTARRYLYLRFCRPCDVSHWACTRCYPLEPGHAAHAACPLVEKTLEALEGIAP